MKPGFFRYGGGPLLLALLCWAGAAALFAGMTSALMTTFWSGAGDDLAASSLVHRLLGSSRSVLSRRLLFEADRYFHKGIGPMAGRHDESWVYARWAEMIAPSVHQEVQAGKIHEVLPWLELAWRADPRNYEACAAGAYWLMRDGRMSEAVRLLRGAQTANPDDWRFRIALGELLIMNNDPQVAVVELRAARRLWEAHADPGNPDHLRQLASTLTYLGAACEATGDLEGAKLLYEEVLGLAPERTELLHRLERWDAEGAAANADGLHQVLPFTALGAHVHHQGCQHDHPDADGE